MASRRIHVVLAAIAVGIGAFGLYRATLLPGFDFGDTASFQATAGSSLITPRDGYPLYFAIGQLFVWVTGAERASALNLASAVTAAAACGVMVLVAVELSGSITAGVGAALLFATSYTFWSQAVIAEVYALHMALVSLTLLLTLRWSNRPSIFRLTLVLAVYAVAFGNHLSMILLLPALTLFFLVSAPGGWRAIVTPRIVAIALACACIGASQYAWNLRTLYLLPDPPDNAADALQRFWFDVTKSDWRDTMVMNVPPSMLIDHAAMYWFDLRQQFGMAAPLLAVLGLAQLAITDIRRAMLMLVVYLTNMIFAFSYNVGDSHVFYLPSHLIIAMLAAPAAVLAGRILSERARAATPAFAALLIVYAAIRGYRDFPALDRSADDRPARVLTALTSGLDDRQAILLTDLNWQVQNGLSYYAGVRRPELAVARMSDVLLYAPALVADNRAIGRDVVVTERARATAAAAYGPMLSIAADPRLRVAGLADAADRIPPGTRYVVCVLRPSRDLPLDRDDLSHALTILSGGEPVSLPAADYAVVAGTAGRQPDVTINAALPFKRTITLQGVDVGLRMESWLSSDTIRRMGFGHVVVARRHTLIVERGVSLVAFDERGHATETAYASNIFAPLARYLIDIAGNHSTDLRRP